MTVVAFLSSSAGRVVRAVLGLVMIGVGVILGGGWYVLAVIGLIPLAAGVLDICLIAPLLRRPMAGKKFRAQTAPGGQ